MAAEGRDSGGRFAPGNPGGPGRQKSPRRIEGILQRIGEQRVLVEGGETITRLDRLMLIVYGLAEEGNQWAVQFVAERTEGKIREAQVDHAEIAEPIKILDLTLEEVQAESD